MCYMVNSITLTVGSSKKNFTDLQMFFLYTQNAAKDRLEGLIQNVEQPQQLTPGGQGSLVCRGSKVTWLCLIVSLIGNV